MDKKYFLNDGKKQFGPLSFDEISKMPLKETNKVWVEGSENWKDITEYEELKPLLIKIPPPIPKNDKTSKFIAKEIKVNFKLLIVGLVIGICSYPVLAYLNHGFKSISYRNQLQQLSKDFYGYEGSTTDTLTDEQNSSKKYSDFKSKQAQLISEVLSYMPEEDIVLVSPDPILRPTYQDRIAWGSALNNNIQRAFGEDTILSSIGIFLLASLILIAGRYVFKYSKSGMKWVYSNAKE